MIERLRILWHSQDLANLSNEYHLILNKYNDYYKSLNKDLQRTFRERVYVSSQFINFKPVDFDVVSEEMKILITSALIQITLALDKFILRRFNTIMVVPNTYSFREYAALLGHVDYDENLIAMSWPSVKSGFIIPDDAHNVALHELAHALHRENHDRMFFADFFDAVSFNSWTQTGLTELYKIRRRSHSYLRDYAGQNMLELFAVCMECFFEQPEAFKRHVPGLYHIMTKLLKQDPSKGDNPIL